MHFINFSNIRVTKSDSGFIGRPFKEVWFTQVQWQVLQLQPLNNALEQRMTKKENMACYIKCCLKGPKMKTKFLVSSLK